MIDPVLAISPIDGRYAARTQACQTIFSEHALMQYRLRVEVAWLLALSDCPALQEIPAMTAADQQWLWQWVDAFAVEDATAIKKLERTTNHDVKAVEYYLKAQLSQREQLLPYAEFVHFACTSEDINNIAYALMLQDARTQLVQPALSQLIEHLDDLRQQHAGIAMLARTHGQAASPTTLGKEWANVRARLLRAVARFEQVSLLAKMNGAVGNYNAHRVAYPELDWPAFSATFIDSLGLACNRHTTQIEPHDSIADYCHQLAHINTVLIDLSRDLWGYIALAYFKQQPVAGEVGSSTMPHKVNPIDFENAEGNLGIANALLYHFASKLPISRWQRDLSDSTVLRNLGVAVAYGQISYQAILRGFAKLAVNESVLAADLARHPEVLAEAVQTVMRRYGLPQPYEQLKTLTRGHAISADELRSFIQSLGLPAAEQQRLLALTPATYVGFAAELAVE